MCLAAVDRAIDCLNDAGSFALDTVLNAVLGAIDRLMTRALKAIPALSRAADRLVDGDGRRACPTWTSSQNLVILELLAAACTSVLMFGAVYWYS